MGKKVCVYAICKNEEQFVDRWMDSMGEADQVVVLDTGSTDCTVEKLRARGALVTVEDISPWRFDVARNRALELVPEDMDICVCTDLDEVFHPGWREQVEQAWVEGTSQGRYRYTWSFLPDGSEGYVFWIEKVHQRRGFVWTHPVHEVLTWTGPEERGRTVWIDGVQLDHHPDPTKSRGQYLPLLELSVAEDPADDRNLHYLGREYMFYGRWDDCIAALKKHLALPTATWDERSASMRYIARSYWAKGDAEQAHSWYLRTIAQAPHLREGYLDLARMLYQRQDWDGVLYATGCALRITQRPRSYISEADSWGSLPHDLRCISYYRTGRVEQALEEAKKARAMEPGQERLQENVRILEELLTPPE